MFDWCVCFFQYQVNAASNICTILERCSSSFFRKKSTVELISPLTAALLGLYTDNKRHILLSLSFTAAGFCTNTDVLRAESNKFMLIPAHCWKAYYIKSMKHVNIQAENRPSYITVSLFFPSFCLPSISDEFVFPSGFDVSCSTLLNIFTSTVWNCLRDPLYWLRCCTCTWVCITEQVQLSSTDCGSTGSFIVTLGFPAQL